MSRKNWKLVAKNLRVVRDLLWLIALIALGSAALGWLGEINGELVALVMALLGVGAAIAAYVVQRSIGTPLGSPHFRRVRFFRTTDPTVDPAEVRKVKIERVGEPPQPYDESPNLPVVPGSVGVPPGGAVVHEASENHHFYTTVNELAVTVEIENLEVGGLPLVGSFHIMSGAPERLITDLNIALGGEPGSYRGIAQVECVTEANGVPIIGEPVYFQIPGRGR